MTYTLRDNTIEFRSETKTGCVRCLVQWYKQFKRDVACDYRELSRRGLRCIKTINKGE